MKDVHTAAGAHPHHSVIVFFQNAYLPLAVGFIEEVTKTNRAILLDSQIESAAKRAYPHTLFGIGIETENMIAAQ